MARWIFLARILCKYRIMFSWLGFFSISKQYFLNNEVLKFWLPNYKSCNLVRYRASLKTGSCCYISKFLFNAYFGWNYIVQSIHEGSTLKADILEIFHTLKECFSEILLTLNIGFLYFMISMFHGSCISYGSYNFWMICFTPWIYWFHVSWSVSLMRPEIHTCTNNTDHSKEKEKRKEKQRKNALSERDILAWSSNLKFVYADLKLIVS